MEVGRIHNPTHATNVSVYVNIYGFPRLVGLLLMLSPDIPLV